jgi:hypothetical protein
MEGGKLSKLQRFILVALLSDESAYWTRCQFSEFVYHKHFQWKSKATFASLSRALSRLEQRGLIGRVRGKWQLTQELSDNGMLIAALEWADLITGKKPNVLGDFSSLHWKAVRDGFAKSSEKKDDRSPEQILDAMLNR